MLQSWIFSPVRKIQIPWLCNNYRARVESFHAKRDFRLFFSFRDKKYTCVHSVERSLKLNTLKLWTKNGFPQLSRPIRKRAEFWRPRKIPIFFKRLCIVDSGKTMYINMTFTFSQCILICSESNIKLIYRRELQSRTRRRKICIYFPVKTCFPTSDRPRALLRVAETRFSS